MRELKKRLFVYCLPHPLNAKMPLCINKLEDVRPFIHFPHYPRRCWLFVYKSHWSGRYPQVLAEYICKSQLDIYIYVCKFNLRFKTRQNRVLDFSIHLCVQFDSLISPCSWLLATLLASPHARRYSYCHPCDSATSWTSFLSIAFYIYICIIRITWERNFGCTSYILFTNQPIDGLNPYKKWVFF